MIHGYIIRVSFVCPVLLFLLVQFAAWILLHWVRCLSWMSGRYITLLLQRKILWPFGAKIDVADWYLFAVQRWMDAPVEGCYGGKGTDGNRRRVNDHDELSYTIVTQPNLNYRSHFHFFSLTVPTLEFSSSSDGVWLGINGCARFYPSCNNEDKCNFLRRSTCILSFSGR